VQHYDWGGTEYIPTLLGIENEAQRPYAELWIGAHPDLPSHAVIGENTLALDFLIDSIPEVLLCPEVSTRFAHRLPFLLKVLSVRKPLSVQAHPNQRQAQKGFARENAQGISLDDETRNYRDEHHKPELLVALTDFYALRGFRSPAEIATILRCVPEFAPFASGFQPTRASLIDLYSSLMRLPQQEVDSILDPLVKRLTAEHRLKPFDKEDVAYWVLGADRDHSKLPHRDRGIFSIYLLNFIHLHPEQAMYLPAGELHSYLEGTGVEIMANSNNVLRGGLTPKHVDIDELFKILTFDHGNPEVLAPQSETGVTDIGVYETPAEEYELWRMRIDRGQFEQVCSQRGIQLGIVTEGSVSLVESDGTRCEFDSGHAFLVPCDVTYRVSSTTGATVFLAHVPSERSNEAKNPIGCS
jgi:mannose-6-phosphate isomerase class I